MYILFPNQYEYYDLRHADTAFFLQCENRCHLEYNEISELYITEGFFLFSLLHRACCRVTRLLHQPLHIHKIYKILHIKTFKIAPTCFGPKTILRELYLPC